MEPNSASALKLTRERQRAPAPRAPGGPSAASHIVAVGGGKGGVGKSFVASCLGIALARRGQRVVMVDADLGGANLHTALGQPPPKLSLTHLLHKRVKHIDELRTDTDIPNLSLVAGATDHLMGANITYQQKNKLLRQIRNLDADFTIVDIGAGTSWNVVDFFLVADRGIVLVAPEPAAVQALFRFAKTCLFRKLWTAAPSKDTRDTVLRIMSETSDDNSITFSEVASVLREDDPDAARAIEEAGQTFRPWLMVNHVRYAEDKRLGPTMAGVCFKHLGIDMDYLNPIYYDDRVWQGNRDGVPYMLAEPQAPAAKNLDRAAGRLLLQRHSVQSLAIGGH